ncbi:hypothetical protein L6654_41780 [Bradyrhizobium sp. WYCCWR 13023]|uniref:Uncharacterized protein n=1 Tax=Bradyrhizobium zhengyangense TaxID=2911009 RepID=A0A9X1REU1_9BRAD|nr:MULTISPECIES: hypothetical protein [Bradyrhizobium]MCG2633082.1 hypothetical protein [Bradyrhizobium zhengyangense]MCG2673330.1 hypothetical protein [Bradyrhizobium zhengyangense]MDA9521684.1 hypothetical protein [Bradyrhizobium sp. CCBAU 11434]
MTFVDQLAIDGSYLMRCNPLIATLLLPSTYDGLSNFTASDGKALSASSKSGSIDPADEPFSLTWWPLVIASNRFGDARRIIPSQDKRVTLPSLSLESGQARGHQWWKAVLRGLAVKADDGGPADHGSS